MFYGLGMDPVHGVPYLRHWSEIAQVDLAIDEPVRIAETDFVAEKPSTAHGTTTEHWTNLGRRVRAMVNNKPTS